MDMQRYTLFLKLVKEDYKLTEPELSRLGRRMLADEREFIEVWEQYQIKARQPKDGVDEFKAILTELLS